MKPLRKKYFLPLTTHFSQFLTCAAPVHFSLNFEFKFKKEVLRIC